MKKTLILYSIIGLIFAGCVAKKEPVVKEEVKKEIVEEPIIIEEKKPEPIVEKKIVKKHIPFTFYKIIPSKIEVFPYKRLYKTTLIKDTKLNNSFYVKGDLIRIEKIYTSEIGDKYGKIVGKNLLVSMDDLRKRDENN
ncbi:hypothetical protein ACMC56_05655 [Campylobacterota bacterium DY0563]